MQRFFVAATDRITTGASLVARKECLTVLRRRMLERVGEALLGFKEQLHSKLQDAAVCDLVVAAASNTALPDLDNKEIDSATEKAVRERMFTEVYKSVGVVVNREFAALLHRVFVKQIAISTPLSTPATLTARRALCTR